MTTYAQDTYYTPIIIDTTNNVFVVTEDPGGTPNVLTVTLDAGTYYLHADTSFHATKKGLLYAIAKLLNDGTTSGVGTATGTNTNTYTWAVITPTSSTGLTNNGLQLRADSANADFEITWTGATTLPGFPLGTTLDTPLVDQSSATSGSDEVISFVHATRHRMVTRTLGGDNYATDKRKHHYKDSWRSSSRPSDSVSVVWDEGFNREILYEDVIGVEVHQYRANESEWAATSTRATTDYKATWFDVWDTLTDDLEIIVVHNSSDDLQIDTHSYEVCKLAGDATWGQMFTQTSAGGDLYDVYLDLWVDTANSDYDH